MARTSSVQAHRFRRSHRLGPALWSLGAQALSSATNFALTLVLLIVVAPDELGRVISTMSVYLLALTLSRSIVSEPLIASAGDSSSGKRSWPQARKRTLGIAAGAMLVAAVVGLALRVDEWSLVVVVSAMPILLLQDGARYQAMATNRHRLTVAADGVWLLVSGLLLGALVSFGPELGPGIVIGCWAAGGVASWVLLARALAFGTATAGGDLKQPPANTSDRYRVLAQSQVVSVTAVNVTPLLVAALLSPALAAAAKAVLFPFAALLSLVAGLRVVTLPAIREAIDRGDGTGTVSRLLIALVSAVGVVSALLVWVVGLVDPAVFGPSFVLAAPHLLLGGVLCVLYVVSQQLADAVALTGRGDAPFLRVVGVGLEWAGTLLGGAVAGVSGMISGWTIGLALAAGLWSTAWLHRSAVH